MKIDRPWEEYPVGTKAYCINGGFWEKTKLGWAFSNGATFPTPGASAHSVLLPLICSYNPTLRSPMDIENKT